jgi:hypothetical protein
MHESNELWKKSAESGMEHLITNIKVRTVQERRGVINFMKPIHGFEKSVKSKQLGGPEMFIGSVNSEKEISRAEIMKRLWNQAFGLSIDSKNQTESEAFSKMLAYGAVEEEFTRSPSVLSVNSSQGTRQSTKSSEPAPLELPSNLEIPKIEEVQPKLEETIPPPTIPSTQQQNVIPPPPSIDYTQQTTTNGNSSLLPPPPPPPPKLDAPPKKLFVISKKPDPKLAKIMKVQQEPEKKNVPPPRRVTIPPIFGQQLDSSANNQVEKKDEQIPSPPEEKKEEQKVEEPTMPDIPSVPTI